ncbi:MAG: hypothetical protein WCH34_11905 [Bacteroidota bacterium]
MPSKDLIPHKNNVFDSSLEIFVNITNVNINDLELTDSALEEWIENTIL